MWRNIENASNYEISDKGEVRNKTTEYILKGRITKSGYLQVNIKLDNIDKFQNKYIHRLVAETFLFDSYSDGKNVNHKDGNKLNNNLENLEWITYSENSKHVHQNDLIKKTSNRHIGMYDKNNVLVKEFDSVVEAFKELNKPSRVNIDNALQGKQKTAYGYFWRYLD